MSKKNLVKPQKNIDYTFIFSDGKHHTLRYYGENDAGKYIFFNVKTKKFVAPMTPRRFDYMYERQLKCMHYAQTNTTASKSSTEQTKSERLLFDKNKAASFASSVEQEDSGNIDHRNIRFLTALTASERKDVESFLGKNIDEFISEYNKSIKDDDLAGLTIARFACMKLCAKECAV